MMSIDQDGVEMLFPTKPGTPSFRLAPSDDANNKTDFGVEAASSSTKHTEGGVTFWNVVGKTVHYASGQPDGKTVRIDVYNVGAKGHAQTATWKDKPKTLWNGDGWGYRDQEFTSYIRVHSNTGTHTEG